MKKYILLLLVLLISISIGCISKTALVIDNEKYVLVPGGTFQMGSASGECLERPVHSVTVSSFYMGKYEVTQKEYKDIIGISVRQQRDKLDPDWPMSGERNNYPMYYVSWYEAVEYCNALSRKEGLTPCYSGSGGSISCNINANGYRLPTEAEWEYAARGGTSSRGYTYSGSNTIGNVAWYNNNSGNKTHPVGTKQANELGLYDMSGNVWEWCWDWYGSYPSSSQSDPVGKSSDSGPGRIVRGGGWSYYEWRCRSAFRTYYEAAIWSNYLGFRVVRRP